MTGWWKCHFEPFDCHSERSEESPPLAQDKLCEKSNLMHRNFNVLRFPLKLVLARFYRGACGNDMLGMTTLRLLSFPT